MSSPAPMDEDPVEQPPAAVYDQVFVPPAQADSDVSSDEDEAPAQPAPAPAASSAEPEPAAAVSPSADEAAARSPPASPRSATGSAQDEDAHMTDAEAGDEERAASASADEGSDGDDYDGGAAEDGAGSSISFKKTGKKGDGSADKSEGRKKKKRRKASPSPEREGSPVPVQTEDDIRRAALNRRIDEIIKKPAGRRKRNKDDEDLDQYADDMIQNLKDRMLDAADKDEALGKEGRDATAKEAMLQDVVNVLQQSTLLQSIVDNDLLSAVRRWLEPLPDKTLPSLGIQTSFFEILVKMDIDTATLKSCGLGKIVIFYTKSRRSTLRVKRLAEQLQLAWLRPLVKKSAAYRTKVVQEVDVKDVRKPLPKFKTLSRADDRSKREESLTPGGERSEIKAQSIGNKRRGARIPMSQSLSFTVAPRFDSAQPSQSSQGGSGANIQEAEQAKRQRDAERLKKVKNRLNEARRAEKT